MIQQFKMLVPWIYGLYGPAIYNQRPQHIIQVKNFSVKRSTAPP